jgi:hypothetical protein
MERGIGTLGTLGTALGLGLALGAAGGCAASGGDQSIIVLRNVQPTAGCVLTAMESEVGISHGTLDAQFHTGYVFAAQLKSRITADTTQEDQRTIFIDGANVDLTFPGSMLFSAAELADLKTMGLTHFKSEFSTILKPNGGLSDVGFELIPAELVDRIAAKSFTQIGVDASFTVVGDLSGGGVSSQTFHYPVTIVSQGLLHNAGACSELATSFAPKVGNPCNPGQDGLVDCCKDPAGKDVCPAVGTKSAVDALD